MLTSTTDPVVIPTTSSAENDVTSTTSSHSSVLDDPQLIPSLWKVFIARRRCRHTDSPSWSFLFVWVVVWNLTCLLCFETFLSLTFLSLTCFVLFLVFCLRESWNSVERCKRVRVESSEMQSCERGKGCVVLRVEGCAKVWGAPNAPILRRVQGAQSLPDKFFFLIRSIKQILF